MEERLLVTIGFSGVIHLIGHNFMMQMDSFNLWVLIRFLDLISVPNHDQRFIYFNTIQHIDPIEARLLVTIGFTGVIHLIGHIFMMQMDSFNFGF